MNVTTELANVKGYASTCKPPYIALDRKEALRSGSALAQGIDYRLPKSVGGLWGQILYDQLRSVAPMHRDLEQVGGGVPEAIGRRSRVVHLVERHELLALGETVAG